MLLVVGGQSRNIGKTSVAAGLIRRLRDCNWTALKITQHGEGVCAHSGSACGCEAGTDHPYELTEEYEPGPGDSARFLAAGARRSFWLRTPAGQLRGALTAVEKIRAIGLHTIIESNSILEFLQPDLYLVVLDLGCGDFKPSALRFMDRADAFVLIDRGINVSMWEGISRGLWDSKPRFAVRPPVYVPPALSAFVRQRLPAGC